MSSSVAGSIPCKKIHWVQAEDTELAISQMWLWIHNYNMSNMSGMQKSAANKLLYKGNNIPMPMLQKENNIFIPMKGLIIL